MQETAQEQTAQTNKAAANHGHLPPTGSATLDAGFGFLEENAKIFIALGIVAALGALGYLGFDFLTTRQEKAAQVAFYSVEAKFTPLKEGFDRAKFQKAMPNASTKDTAETKQASGNLEQDYGTLIADFEKVAREHAGTAGGAQAALLAAETYLAYNQPEKAIAIDEIAAKSTKADKVLGALTRIQWGSAIAAKGDCQGAIEVWQQVLDSQKVVFLHADTALRAGICFETLGNAAKAMEMYRKASAEGGEQSPTARTAKSFLRALEVKANAGQG